VRAGLDPEYDPLMGVLWVGLAIAAAVGLVAAVRLARSSSQSEGVEVGSVSEAWLSDQRARKD
jgi:hypothetical protein